MFFDLSMSPSLLFVLVAAGIMAAPVVQASESQNPSGATSGQPEQTQEKNAYPYFSVQLGAGFPPNYSGDMPNLGRQTSLDLNNGFNAEAAIGYRINDFRVDLSVGYGGFGLDQQSFSAQGQNVSFRGDGAVDVLAVMANVYYDVPLKLSSGKLSRWSPYVGGGVGYANVSYPSCVSGCYGPGSDDSFAWQAKIGVAYRATDSGFIFLEGGYLGTVNNSVSNVIDFGNFATWRLNLGWRQRFGG